MGHSPILASREQTPPRPQADPASASSTEPQQPHLLLSASPRQRAPDGPHAGHQAPRLGHHAALALGALAPHSRGLTTSGARATPQDTGSPAEAHRRPLGPPPRRGGTQRGTRQPPRRMPPPPEAAPAPHPRRRGHGPAKVGPGRPPPPFIGPVGGALGPLPVAQPPGPCKGHARPAGASPAGCRARQPLQGHRGGRLRRLPRRCSGARATALAGPP